MTTESLVPLKTAVTAPTFHVPEPQDVLAVWNIEPQPVRKYVCEHPIRTWHSGVGRCCAPATNAASGGDGFWPMCEAHANELRISRTMRCDVVHIDTPKRIMTLGTGLAKNWVQLSYNPNFVPH